MGPKLVFVMVDQVSGETWEIPAILGLRICAPCRARATGPGEFLADHGAKIVEALRRSRPTATHHRTRLEWISCDSKEWRMVEPSS